MLRNRPSRRTPRKPGSEFSSSQKAFLEFTPINGNRRYKAVCGHWMLVSETAHQEDKTSEPLAPNPSGPIMFDQSGRFMLLIVRSGLLKFAADKRDAGRREENKAVLAGLLAFTGSHTVSEADQVLTLQVEASTFPNWVGTNQKRCLTLIGDGMKWTNRTPAIGAKLSKSRGDAPQASAWKETVSLQGLQRSWSKTLQAVC